MKCVPCVAAFCAAFPLMALAHGYSLGAIDIDHPHVVAASASALSSAGYLTLTNAGAADRLLAVTSPVAQVTMHETTVDADGVARMQAHDAVDLPQGAMVTFEPGGLHLMFTDLATGLEDGGKVPATLTFEVAGSIGVEFNVEMKGGVGHDHAATAGD